MADRPKQAAGWVIPPNKFYPTLEAATRAAIREELLSVLYRARAQDPIHDLSPEVAAQMILDNFELQPKDWN
jgi:hypothetical protein